MLEPGTMLNGTYRIIKLLARGGMSNVYLAVNDRAKRFWAVKELVKDRADSERNSLMLREIRLLMELHHSALVEIADVIDASEYIWIIMDYIEGRNLQTLLQEEGPQDMTLAAEWGIQLCKVIGYLHERPRPVIYRDLKPSNIMLTPEGSLVLIDLGIAREYKEQGAEDTICLGTVGYAAPEQYIRDAQTDVRTDIYGIGATLYAMLTGREPASYTRAMIPIHQIRPGISQGLERIVSQCLETDPMKRFQNCGELQYALQHYQELEHVYSRTQNRKLWRFVLCVMVVMTSFALSTGTEYAGEVSRAKVYETCLEKANDLKDLEAAMVLDPGRVEAYEMWIRECQKDGVLSVEEQSELQMIRLGVSTESDAEPIDVLVVLKERDPSGYAQICYEMGNLELYYGSEVLDRDRFANAAVWYELIAENNPVAYTYCVVADCLEQIDDYRSSRIPQPAKTSEAYQELWAALEELEDQCQILDDPDIRYQIWNEIQSMVRDNAMPLCHVAGKGQVLELLTEVERQMQAVPDDAMDDFGKGLEQDLQETIEKINSISD